MIAILLFALAGILDALSDTIETEISFNASRLKHLNPKFWCKPISAHAVKTIPGTKYRPDAWHLAKSISIILQAGAAVSAFYYPIFDLLASTLLNILIAYALLGVAWIVSFNIFFNRIFSNKIKKIVNG
jgi:hypothetical protein